ncbi:MAG: hypothetical protein OXU61_11955 [Gammaproteobacteria bacterium]|nr:hypothetical protein [Gammaproteobacteria bacterium]
MAPRPGAARGPCHNRRCAPSVRNLAAEPQMYPPLPRFDKIAAG